MHANIGLHALLQSGASGALLPVIFRIKITQACCNRVHVRCHHPSVDAFCEVLRWQPAHSWDDTCLCSSQAAQRVSTARGVGTDLQSHWKIVESPVGTSTRASQCNLDSPMQGFVDMATDNWHVMSSWPVLGKCRQQCSAAAAHATCKLTCNSFQDDSFQISIVSNDD